MSKPQPNSSFSRGFTLIELIVVMAIIAVLAAVTAGSFGISQRRARDSRRKSDLGQVAKSLEAYYNDRGSYPPDNSNSGQILGCGTTALPTLCTWGTSFAQRAAGATTDTLYMVTLPSDPRAPNFYYYYDSAGGNSPKSYQLYARLENVDDKDVLKDGNGDAQVYSGLSCGTYSCNYGISSANTSPTTGRTLTVE